MQIIENIPVFGPPDPGAVAQIKNARETGAAHTALMGDHHVGYGVPIGGVVAYHELVSPSAVGYDIACGNKAVLTDARAEDVRQKIRSIMDDVFAKVSFGMGRANNEEVDHELFDDPLWERNSVVKSLKDKARQQLGTVGSGNHYVNIMVDESDRVWIGVHFGSRGLGHGIASYYIDQAKRIGNERHQITWLHEHSPLGEEYIACMELAGKYAYAGRDWVCRRVAKILGAKILDEVHNHHNFAWKERHDGENLWVVRKGATPAFPGQRGFVGATMAEPSVILEGVESERSPATLYSTVHGAGRVMSRTQAKGKKGSAGQISRSNMEAWVNRAKVELRGADVDEAPQCYKRLDDVLRHHEGTIRVIHRLTPVGVAMAGKDVFDPYKD
ncbi:MAG: RtcB family protein [Armatimonadetes bacterium]|nr:RtcB family protein [Armatimonadota bacterium]MBX3107938.1 RtcB family protein [Fimbriimonadaceae bacterium]